MKTLTTLLFAAATLLPLAPASSRGAEAEAYAIADATSGHLLESVGGDKKLQIASLTKIATAMVVLDWAEGGKRDLSTVVSVPRGAAAIAGSNPIGLQAGDQVSLRDLLYAALLQSDNIAAYTLADHVGHSLMTRDKAGAAPVDLFVAQMNALARKLRMQKTRFLNPHGLDHEEQPYSTANDLVLLTSYAMKRSSFRFYVSQKNRRIAIVQNGGPTIGYNLINTNELLGIDGIDGVKTGRTNRAGACLIVSAARQTESVQNADGSHTITPRRIIVVVLNAPDRFTLASRLTRHGWSRYDAWAAKGRPL